MSERALVPRSPIGEELDSRFREYAFRTNPSDSPMARALVAHGYQVGECPLYPSYTDSDWFCSTVSMRGLKIIFRQPTPADLLVCFIEREATIQKVKSPLFGIVEFFSFCRYSCPGLEYVGGHIDKNIEQRNSAEELKMERLVAFYNRLLGGVEAYENNGQFSIYAEVHRNERFKKFPIWERCRNKSLALTS